MIRFVTGTDTGVGKTVAAAALCRAEREAGRTVLYAKPVQTGLAPGEPGDAAWVAAAAGVATVECLRFADPLAPAVAAERAGAVIDLDALLANLDRAADGFDRLVVEGAGGLLVPLTRDRTEAERVETEGPGGLPVPLTRDRTGAERVETEGTGGLPVPLTGEVTMADLALRLGAGLVIVTRPGLGTLNHTALTLEAARARGIPVDGLVVSGWPADPGVTETTNLERLAAMAPVLGLLPAAPGLDTAEPSTASLQPAFLSGSSRRW